MYLHFLTGKHHFGVEEAPLVTILIMTMWLMFVAARTDTVIPAWSLSWVVLSPPGLNIASGIGDVDVGFAEKERVDLLAHIQGEHRHKKGLPLIVDSGVVGANGKGLWIVHIVHVAHSKV